MVLFNKSTLLALLAMTPLAAVADSNLRVSRDLTACPRSPEDVNLKCTLYKNGNKGPVVTSSPGDSVVNAGEFDEDACYNVNCSMDDEVDYVKFEYGPEDKLHNAWNTPYWLAGGKTGNGCKNVGSSCTDAKVKAMAVNNVGDGLLCDSVTFEFECPTEPCYDCGPPDKFYPRRECPKDEIDCGECKECKGDLVKTTECPRTYSDCKCPDGEDEVGWYKCCPKGEVLVNGKCQPPCGMCPADLEPQVECIKNPATECCYDCTGDLIPAIACPKKQEQCKCEEEDEVQQDGTDKCCPEGEKLGPNGECECIKRSCPSKAGEFLMFRTKASKNECEQKCVKPNEVSKKESEGFSFCPCTNFGEDTCDVCDKPKLLTFLFDSSNDVVRNSQGSGKSEVSGSVNGASSVFIMAGEGEGEGAYFMGTVTTGNSFTITDNGDKFSSNTYITMYSSQGGQLLQTSKVHTSCSAPIVKNDNFGAIELIGYLGQNSNAANPCGFGFDVINPSLF